MHSRRPALDPNARREASIAERQKVRAADTVRSLHRATMGGSVKPVVKEQPKLTRRQKVRPDIRDAARGEPCLIRIPGCPNDPEQTIWSHYPGAAGDKGMGTKSLDVCGCMSCTYCDAVVDGQRKPPPGWTRADVMLAWHEGHLRSLVRLAEKGLL